MDANLKSRLAVELDRSLNRPPAGEWPLEDGISIASVNHWLDRSPRVRRTRTRARHGCG